MPTRSFALAVLCAVFTLSAPPAAPAGTTALRLAGLQRPAEVVRDGSGVPHVYAASDHDAYFVLGWLHAQDRLFQMDQSRRQGSGTLAELLGPGSLSSGRAPHRCHLTLAPTSSSTGQHE